MWTALLFDEAVIRTLQETLPPVVITLFAGLTVLGELPVYVVALLVYYYGVNRERGAALLVVGLSISAVTVGLKELLAFERPPSELHDPRTAGGGYALPSGHTLSAFVIYGSVLSAIDSLSRAQKWAIGVLVVGAVGASRVVLGVHYPGDVLGAWVVGTVVLVLYLGVAKLAMRETTLIALVLSVPLVVYHGGLEDMYFGLGGLLGVAMAWWLVGTDYHFDLRTLRGAALTGVGIAIVLLTIAVLQTAGAPALPGAAGAGFVAAAYPDAVRAVLERGERADTGQLGEVS